MSCKCNQSLGAFGLPDCTLIPERIRRAFFVPTLAGKIADNADPSGYPNFPPPTGGPVWAYEPDLVSPTAPSLWTKFWAWVTPWAENGESEKPESVREDVGGTPVFVRESARTVTFTYARKPAELGYLLSALRCQKTLGVFLLDAEGVLWGRRGREWRGGGDIVAPIPVVPSTVDARMVFAGATTAQKYLFSFQLAEEFRDYDFVPVFINKELLTYQPPVALEVEVKKVLGAQVAVAIFARFARGARGDNVVPLTTIPSPTPRAYDAAGTDLGPTTWTAEPVPGVFTISFPAGTRTIRFAPADLLAGITPSGFDWYHFRIDIP